MTSIADGSLHIQTSSETQIATPCWLGEIALVASHLQKQGILNKISEHIRFARRRFGRYEVLDFLAVLARLCRQRRANLARLLHNRAAICFGLHGVVRTNTFTCGLDAQPLFSGASRRACRSPSLPFSGGSARPPSLPRRTRHGTLGSAGEPLDGLRCRRDTRSGASTSLPPDTGSTCSSTTVAAPLRAWLHWTQTRGGRLAAYNGLADAYASVGGQLWPPRKWPISRGATASEGGHPGVRESPQLSGLAHAAAPRWPVWLRGGHR